ncbi:MAG: S9 family peptidase [Parvularculaceae bacterium]
MIRLRSLRRHALPAILAIVGGAAIADDLTPERIHQSPSLSGPGLRAPAISPDGARATFLRGREDDAQQLDLWEFNIASGETRRLVSSTELLAGPEILSEEEKNRRERQRLYGRGIVTYQWDAHGRQILFPIGGDVYLYELDGARVTRVTETDAFETDARISPTGRYVSYVRDDEIVVYDASSGTERQVTSGADGVIRNGVASFVVQEELDRDTGYWWSPDERYIVFTQIDESPVEIVARLDLNAEGGTIVRQRYPFAGADNVTIRLAVTTPQGGEPVWIDLGDDPDIYIARVYWSADSKTIYIERLDREQKQVDFLAADPDTGASRVLFTERYDTWINIHDNFHALADGGFIRGSERSGFMHLYRHNADGSIAGAITQGDWPVDGLECVDEAAGVVYFSGWTDTPLERHLYRASFSGGAPARITTGSGWHSSAMSGNCAAFLDTFSNQTTPPQVSLRDSGGEFITWLNENRLDENHPYAPYLDSHVDWEFGTLAAEDGQTLYYQMMTPPGLRRRDRAPAVVLVYGGPHAQRVRNQWGNAFAQVLVDNGFIVFRVDNRGAGNRGTAFENVLYRTMGAVEVADQARATREVLLRHPNVDPDRIGVYGWSYGGFMTLMMMAREPELYPAGVVGAPVTDWRLYDTAYTERYLGDPNRVPEVYEQSSPLSFVDALNGEMLVIHGMADDNVLFENSIRLMAALQARGKAFELMTFPGEKHGFRQEHNRIYRDRLILDFFNRKLAR